MDHDINKKHLSTVLKTIILPKRLSTILAAKTIVNKSSLKPTKGVQTSTKFYLKINQKQNVI